jgi:hypothetical protein
MASFDARARDCRLRAKQLTELADAAREPQRRLKALELAREWTALAEGLEGEIQKLFGKAGRFRRSEGVVRYNGPQH